MLFSFVLLFSIIFKVTTNKRNYLDLKFFSGFEWKTKTHEKEKDPRLVQKVKYVLFNISLCIFLSHNSSSQRQRKKNVYSEASSVHSPRALGWNGERWIKYYHSRSESYFILFGHDSDRAKITIYESNIKNEILNDGAISLSAKDPGRDSFSLLFTLSFFFSPLYKAANNPQWLPQEVTTWNKKSRTEK